MTESELYAPVKEGLENTLQCAGCRRIHIEITANNRFSKVLRQKFGEVLSLLEKSFSPDLSGIYQNPREKKIVVEVKKDEITIRDIYQTIAYSELINANVAILTSPKNMTTRIKNFLNKRQDILQNDKRNIFIVRFDKKEKKFLDSSWYPLQPSF